MNKRNKKANFRFRKQLWHLRKVRVKRSGTSWIQKGAEGVVTDVLETGGLGVRFMADQIGYPSHSSHPVNKHECETFWFKDRDVELIPNEEQ